MRFPEYHLPKGKNNKVQYVAIQLHGHMFSQKVPFAKVGNWLIVKMHFLCNNVAIILQ